MRKTFAISLCKTGCSLRLSHFRATPDQFFSVTVGGPIVLVLSPANAIAYLESSGLFTGHVLNLNLSNAARCMGRVCYCAGDDVSDASGTSSA